MQLGESNSLLLFKLDDFNPQNIAVLTTGDKHPVILFCFVCFVHNNFGKTKNFSFVIFFSSRFFFVFFLLIWCFVRAR